MKINYIEDNKGNKLFSFSRHDYKSSEDGSFIDGGFDYIRSNREVKEDDIYSLIKDIREQFTWFNVLDETGNPKEKPMRILLKNIDTSHIINILIYFTEYLLTDEGTIDISTNTQWIAIHLIFLQELKYRQANNL